MSQQFLAIFALVGSMIVAGCGNEEPRATNGSGHVRSSDSPSGSADDDTTPCGAWASDGSSLARALSKDYGHVLDCVAYGRAWVMTTDAGENLPGYIGTHTCTGPCGQDLPKDAREWTFHRFSDKPGSFNRVAGLQGPDAVIFTGASGEVVFDTRSGTFNRKALGTNGHAR